MYGASVPHLIFFKLIQLLEGPHEMIHICLMWCLARVKAEFFTYKREQVGPGEMAQWVRSFATEPDRPSLNPRWVGRFEPTRCPVASCGLYVPLPEMNKQYIYFKYRNVAHKDLKNPKAGLGNCVLGSGL